MAVANPTAGKYIVVNVARGTTLGVGQSDARKGDLVQLQEWWNWDGFVFSLTYESGGAARLVNSFAGRTADVEQFTAGKRLQLWDVDGERGQKWTLTSTGLTTTFQGSTLDTFFIHSGSLALKASGSSGDLGEYVALAAKGGSSSTDQHWAFWPVPTFFRDGLYEIRSKQDVSMCAQIQSDSLSSGAQLVMGYADGSNGDKFWFLSRDGGGYSIVNAVSGLSLGVQASSAVSPSNITQQASSSYENQHWAVYQRSAGFYGPDALIAAEVEIGSYIASDPETYVMDDYLKDTTENARIVMHSANGGDNQRWLLHKTTLGSDFVPVPANVGMTAAVGTYPEQLEMPFASVFYPCWDCTDGWATSGPNHFEYSYQIRSRGEDGYWGPWSWPNGYDVWLTAAVQRDGTRCWKGDGIRMDDQTAWEHTVNFYVRCVSQQHEDGVDSYVNVVGPSAGGTLRLYRVPQVSLVAAGVSPTGLFIEYQSDYDIGRTNIYITSIKDTSGKEWLAGGEAEFLSQDEQGYLFLPCDRVPRLAGDTPLVITYQLGSDIKPRMAGSNTANLTAAYTAGWDEEYSETVAVPTFTFDPTTRNIVATLNHLGTERLWRQTPTSTTEVKGTTSGGTTTFRMPYQYGTGLTLLTSVYDSTNDKWGVARTAVGGAGSAFERESPPCHVWTFDGGSFLVEADEDPLETKRTLEGVYEEHILNKRKHSVVTFAPTVRGEFEVKGMLYEGVTNSDVNGLIALVNAKHAHYAAPSGEEADVAITGATYTRHRQYTSVEVTMIEETL